MPTEAQVIGGHKANLHNPNTSTEAKEHSKDVLRDEHGGKFPRYFCQRPRLTMCCSVVVDGNKTKNLGNVAAGLKG